MNKASGVDGIPVELFQILEGFFNICNLIHYINKLMLKILQARLQQYVNYKLLDVQAGFRKGRGTRDQIADIRWIIEKGNSRKTSTSALLTTPKPLCGSQQTM